MSAKEIISSLIGARLELQDESLFEQFTFWPDHAVQVFGDRNGVAGPVLDYVVTRGGRVKFGFGDGVVSFTWDEIELKDDYLLVKCGICVRECSYTYRPIKRYAVKRPRGLTR
ncbi:MAG: hypothetical protein HOP33_11330 [Verrucomicrobia bacterium]|nr:hypothetical protein [Verrucomicrobiota bacterium]